MSDERKLTPAERWAELARADAGAHRARPLGRLAADARGAALRPCARAGARRGARAVPARRDRDAGSRRLALETMHGRERSPRRASDYLRRPDLGRSLSAESACGAGGLRACALRSRHRRRRRSVLDRGAPERRAASSRALLPHLTRQKLHARPGRDRLAGARRARRRGRRTRSARGWSLVLIGERPGPVLAGFSLGAYLTFAPAAGPHRRRAQLHLEHPARRPLPSPPPPSSSPG